jgi:hemoglobin/transferrin/lactoferrin receptor protein
VNHSRKRPVLICRAVIFCACLLLTAFVQAGAQPVSPRGVVTDESGSPIINAILTLRNPNGTLIRESGADHQGRFFFEGLPPGSYVLTISAPQFEPRRTIFAVPRYESPAITIKLSPAPVRGEITVTANRGAVVEAENSAQIVNVRDQDDFRSRPIATIGNALEGAAGVMAQQSAYGQISPFLRGLTGYQVLNLIDGVRFNNSTFRSGPNQYLAFAEPSQAQRIEAMLGPASSQYGSDALGGAIQLITLPPNFSREAHGEFQTFAASADVSVGADAKFSIGSKRVAWLAGGAWRRHNDLRAGGGVDSHHVFKRFFGLSDDLIRDLYGSRQQDTGFTQYGAHTKLAARLAGDQNLTLWYQRSDLDRVRGYKDLWGGLGRLRSDFEPQALQFLYARYEKSSLNFLDSLSGTFSINSQSDGSIRQGLRTSNPTTGTITRDESQVDSFGYALQATTHIANRNAVVFGGEIYNERIGAWRDDTDPRTNIPVEKRALYPNGSRYTTYGLFAQDTVDLARGKVRATLGGRYTRLAFKTFADRNRDAAGNSLGVVDSSRTFDDLTFNANLSWQMTSAFALNILTGRGFRAPNLNDLGALGLNDLGYEIPAEAAAVVGGLIGTGDGEGVASNGKKVVSLRAERLFNYEFGATLRLRRLYVRAHAFDAELKDPIVRRTLLFPAGGVPSQLADVVVTPIAQTAAQRAQNVVSVATPLDSRAVKAFVNEGKAKYYGVETVFHYTISPQWSTEGNYSYLVGRELDPNRFIRRLPPQQGFLAIRFQPGGKSNWIELSGNFSGAQERLSGGDITDERIGAARRRIDVTDFFQGSLVRPFINAGADGALGTADDLFAPTNESVAQIRDRVLPIGATINGVMIMDDNSRAPLYTKSAGFASINLRGGVAITENLSLNLALMNLLDRNYRIHGSGIDAPGVNLLVGLKFSF